MQRLGKRVWLLLALGVLAAPVSAAGVAYACTALATINTSTTSAVVPGATITVSGKFFAPHDPSDVRTTPAVVHLDRVDGPALAQASPTPASSGGTFSVDITVPAVEPGDHVVIVTQNGIDGRPAYGTPARTVVTVLPAPAQPAAAPDPLPAVAPLGAFPTSPPRAAPRPKTMAQRVAACKSKYKVKSAKTKQGRQRIAARRASCIRLAIRRTT